MSVRIPANSETARSIGSEQAIERLFHGLYAYGEGTEVVPKLAAGEP